MAYQLSKISTLQRSALFVALAAMTTPLWAQTFAGTWRDLGPGPAFQGQVEQIPNLEVVGAINALALHPTDANVIYAGGTNGGLWKTTNATSVSPSWQSLGDSQRR
jgi:hypothetical protein